MILHVDMDAFFASVEQLDSPKLAGKCVIVGRLSGRGVLFPRQIMKQESSGFIRQCPCIWQGKNALTVSFFTREWEDIPKFQKR